jgi:nitrogen regulatory protein PII
MEVPMNYALFLILNDLSKLEAIHNIFFEVGCGATTLDSIGMGKVLLENNINIPVFAGIRKLVDGDKPYNKTIISVIRDEQKLNKAIALIKKELRMDELNKGGIGFIFVVPVVECHGFKLEDLEN